jgi:hypothetical protein
VKLLRPRQQVLARAAVTQRLSQAAVAWTLLLLLLLWWQRWEA